MPPTLKRFSESIYAKKSKSSDSDYHYAKEKYKRNIYKMMLECKNEEIKSGEKSDYFKVFS
ncbi:hypothetical protein CPQ63_002654 [Escherichia coli]|nr:hypothetical protein [Escherichia coli]